MRSGNVQRTAASPAELPVTCSAPAIGGASRVLRWVSGRVNLVTMPWPPPFSLYIALCDRGLLTNGRLSVPDQDAVKGSDWPLGQLVEIKLTFSPLISPYDLNLTYFIFFSFHRRSVRRACLIVPVSCH